MSSYKASQHEFIANLNGTSIGEISFVFSMFPISLWCYYELVLLFHLLNIWKNVVKNPIVLFLFEFSLLVCPVIVSFTWTEYSSSLMVLLSSIALISIVLSWLKKDLVKEEQLQQKQPQKQPFVTCFRAQMMIATCLAILAVDFTIFPRRFAKTETFGVSIMDIGVGAFVFSSGLTSKHARHIPNYTRVGGILRPILPVIVLGFIRLATVKGVKYQEHISEYGVHWNFYFTLASVYFGFLLIRGASIPTALLLVAFYQLLLSNYGLEHYILHAERTNFINMNREGLCSWIGYLSLYILAACIARRWIFDDKMTTRRSFLMLTAIQVLMWMCTYYGSEWIQQPSRRMVNATYISWVLAQCLQLLSLLLLIQSTTALPLTPRLFLGVSKNQLFVFFIANLLTGAVNLSIYTLYTTNLVATFILIGYMIIVSVVAFTLETMNLSVRL